MARLKIGGKREDIEGNRGLKPVADADSKSRGRFRIRRDLERQMVPAKEAKTSRVECVPKHGNRLL